MREPALGGRGLGGLLRSKEREGAQPGARRALEGGSPPLALAQRQACAVWRVPPIWTLPMVGQKGARFCLCSVPFPPIPHL